MKTLPICSAILVALLIGLSSFDAMADQRPNIVIIFADDLGYGDLACFGHPDFKTPRLDRMAKEGARLTNFYVPMPYCAPSRGSILTGRYPFRHGVVRNPCPDAGINDIGLPQSEVTIAEALREVGYATCCIGKWHLGHVPGFFPREHGFDEYFGILYSNDMRPVELIEGEKSVEYPVVQATLTKRYTERAIRFITVNRDRPFFLYLPHAMPHKPLAASDDYYKKTGTGLYGDVITELDWSVGTILDKLKELELEKRTLVVFTSDNGPWFGGYSGGLRGMKGQQWEGGIRVPMIARWPDTIPSGQTIHEMAGTIDLLPTALKLAGASLSKDRTIDGRDIMPVLTQQAKSPHEILVAQHGPKVTTVISGRWKLHVKAPSPWPRKHINSADWIDPRGPDGTTIIAPKEQATPLDIPDPGTEEGCPAADGILLDLQTDPAEQKNVAAAHPDVIAYLMESYEKLLADRGSLLPGATKNRP